jgi:hypothetical protein
MAPDPAVVLLLVVIFSACVVGTSGSYRGIAVPVSFLVGIGALMAVLHRPAWLLDNSGVVAPGRGLRQELEDFQLNILCAEKVTSMRERRSDEIESRFKKGTISSAEYASELSAAAAGTPPDPLSIDARDTAVAMGPRADWWHNGLFSMRVGAVVASPAVAYDIYQYYVNQTFASAATSRGAALELLRIIMGEATLWLSAGFTLGALWILLPGRRGFYKGLALGALVVGAWAADALLSFFVGQASYIDFRSSPVLIVGFLIAVGIVVEIATLKKVERERWELTNFLKLKDTRWIATYGATIFLIGATVFHQVQAGEPLTSLPAAIGEMITNGGGQK